MERSKRTYLVNRQYRRGLQMLHTFLGNINHYAIIIKTTPCYITIHNGINTKVEYVRTGGISEVTSLNVSKIGLSNIL